jgi:hypothetical protein
VLDYSATSHPANDFPAIGRHRRVSDKIAETDRRALPLIKTQNRLRRREQEHFIKCHVDRSRVRRRIDKGGEIFKKHPAYSRTVTGIPITACSKKCAAMKYGRRTHPCEAG